MHDIAVRRLAGNDIAAMRALNAVFASAFDDRAGYAAAPPSDAYLAELLSRPQVVVLVAQDGSAVTGGLVAYELDKFERARREIYIYDLAVDAAWRRRGIATGLIRALQAIAADRGAWVIHVQADPGDAAAIALYSRLGVREDVLHFDIPVPPRPGRF